MSDSEEISEMPGTSSFSHDELLKITSSVLNELLSQDSYLSDLPTDVTCEEVNNQIAVLHGQSITVYVVRGEQLLSVVVPQSGSRVSTLKQAIKRAINLKLTRDEGVKRKVSWRHVWKTHYLQCGEAVLVADDQLLKDAGVRHKSRICFVKRRRMKHV